VAIVGSVLEGTLLCDLGHRVLARVAPQWPWRKLIGPREMKKGALSSARLAFIPSGFREFAGQGTLLGREDSKARTRSNQRIVSLGSAAPHE
jgi:hypothetical protein